MVSNRFQRWATALVLSGWASMAAAVSDMPGGPRVNQLNIADPVG